jgi:uncharacterized protein (DUF305 family)
MFSCETQCHDTLGGSNMAGLVGKSRLDGVDCNGNLRMIRTSTGALCGWLMVASLCSVPGAVTHAQQAQTDPAPVVQPGAPGTPSRRLPSSTTAPAPQRSQADVDFMQGMIMHHGQAVEMTALIPSHTENKDVRSLGARISLSQTDEMRFMKRWLLARGESTSMAMPGMPNMDKGGNAMPMMPGMLTPAQMDALRQATGAEFDRLFLTGMIQHHGGALVMVRELFDTPGAGQDAELFDFATDVDNSQRAEIKIMQGMLKEKR